MSSNLTPGTKTRRRRFSPMTIAKILDGHDHAERELMVRRYAATTWSEIIDAERLLQENRRDRSRFVRMVFRDGTRSGVPCLDV